MCCRVSATALIWQRAGPVSYTHLEKYGHYAEKTYNLVMPGLDGLKDMAQLMKNLRENPPAEISLSLIHI